MKSRTWIVGTVMSVALAASAAPAAAQTPLERLNGAITAILATPYQPAYAPAGLDNAFPLDDGANPAGVPNTAAAQDYTSGSIPGSPDHPNWPTAFEYIQLTSGDGAPLRARRAIHAGAPRPAVVVVHGFNTNGKESVIRWAAMLFKRGFNVLASDQRAFKDEHDHGEGPTAPGGGWRQTFGWKEAEDVLAAGRHMRSLFSVGSIGVMGFSLGGQDAVLALALDAASPSPVFTAGLNFSGPADQNYQIWTTREPNCQPGGSPNCTYPATSALVRLVVPPYNYNHPCPVLDDASHRYGTTAPAILAQLRAYQKQTAVPVPLLSFYSSDDSLVLPSHATLLAGYAQGNPLHRTFLIDQGEHAYFYDRWWQQKAILRYFKALLPEASNDPAFSDVPTVNETPGGTTAHISPVSATPQESDAIANVPAVCPGAPTAASVRSFSAVRRGGSVLLRWQTASEVGIAGFEIYRGHSKLNRRLIRAVGDARGHAYSVRTASPRTSTRYSLDVVRLDGSRTRAGAVRITAR